MEIDLKRIDNSDADPKVKEIYRLLKKYMTQPERVQWLKKRNDCWDAVYEYDEMSSIWGDKERQEMDKKGMIPLVINDLYKGVQGSAAIVTDQKPGINFIPVGSGDLYVAELMKRAHDQVWSQNNGSTEIYEFVRESKVGGLGVMDARHDPAKGIYGKCVFGQFSPENLYYDMQKSRKIDLSDTPILKARLVSKKYAKETYDGITDTELRFFESQQTPDGPVTDTATGADNYTRNTSSEVPTGPDDYPEEKEDVWEIEAHILTRVLEYWLMIPDGSGGFQRVVFDKSSKAKAEEIREQTPESVLWKRVVEKRAMRIICGKKLIKQYDPDGKEVDELVNPYGTDIDGEPILPIVVLPHDKTRKGKPVSPTVFAKEACKERNKRRSQAIYVVSKNVDAPIVTSGAYKWHKDPIHGDMLEVDKSSAFKPDRLTSGSISSEAMNMEAVAKNDIDDMYDMHDVMKGKAPPGDPSGRTILALQDMAGMMSKPFTRALESALERLGKVMMAIILKTWPRSKWERLIEDDEMNNWIPDKLKKPPNPAAMMEGEVEQGPDEGMQAEIAQKWEAALELIRPADSTKEPGISLIDVDVRISAGSTLPTSRMAKRADAMEMVKVGIYDQEAALEYIDDPQKDAVVQRTKAKEQAMMQAAITEQAGQAQ